jgi:hypothetical protein
MPLLVAACAAVLWGRPGVRQYPGQHAEAIDSRPDGGALVRKHLAEPGATITESKLLRDSLGIEREVDIVVEGQFVSFRLG